MVRGAMTLMNLHLIWDMTFVSLPLTLTGISVSHVMLSLSLFFVLFFLFQTSGM